MINSINWIDGLDGLSSGVAFIAAVTLGIISLHAASQVGQPLIAVLCFALAGALLGFLRWNFHPASIFAGTSGVQFVGYTLAVLAILGTAKVAVALLVLGVPIIDTFWIIVRRVSQGRSPFSPDRTHIHHRLLDLGLSHRQTVLVDLRHLPGAGGPVAAAVRASPSCTRSSASSSPSGSSCSCRRAATSTARTNSRPIAYEPEDQPKVLPD